MQELEKNYKIYKKIEKKEIKKFVRENYRVIKKYMKKIPRYEYNIYTINVNNLYALEELLNKKIKHKKFKQSIFKNSMLFIYHIEWED